MIDKLYTINPQSTMLKKMRILLLNWKDIHHPAAGGAEVIVFELARRMVRDGHQVTVFAQSFPRAHQKETLDGVTVIRRGSTFSVYLHAFMYYRALRSKPDAVVDMVNTLPWQTPFYVPAERRAAYVNQLAQEVFFHHLPWPLSRLAYLTERFLYVPYRRTPVICYSASTKDDLVKIGIPGCLIHTFPLGLDHVRYVPGKQKSADPLFICLARLVKMKRVDVCIQALARVVKRYPNTTLVVSGQGPEDEALRRLTASLHLEKNVTFMAPGGDLLTSQSHTARKITYLQQAWALLLPSVKEGWGMVVTEAAACGTPAIVSNVSGLRDSVVHQQTGLIGSSYPSADEMATMMISLIEDSELRARLSAGARAWSERFDWETSYEKFRAILTTLGFSRSKPS